MDKYNVQILFSSEEYAFLKKKADREGLTVSLYIRGKVLKNDAFNSAYKRLLEKVDKLPGGTKFNVKMLFGVEWTMETGVKLNLGRTYYNSVKNGIVTNVIAVGKDSANIMWYKKK